MAEPISRPAPGTAPGGPALACSLLDPFSSTGVADSSRLSRSSRMSGDATSCRIARANSPTECSSRTGHRVQGQLQLLVPDRIGLELRA